MAPSSWHLLKKTLLAQEVFEAVMTLKIILSLTELKVDFTRQDRYEVGEIHTLLPTLSQGSPQIIHRFSPGYENKNGANR